MSQIRLLIYSNCSGVRDRGAEHQALQEALSMIELEDRVEIGNHACFSGCGDPATIVLQGAGMASLSPSTYTWAWPSPGMSTVDACSRAPVGPDQSI